MWPDPDGSVNCLTLCRFFLPIAIILYFSIISQTIKLVEIWGDFDAVIDILTTVDIPITSVVIKMLCSWMYRDVLIQLIKWMEEDWERPNTQIELEQMWKKAKMGRLMSITMISIGLGSVTMQVTTSIYFSISLSKQQSHQEPYNNTARFRPLYLNSEFFYDIQRSPRYEIVWLFQVIVSFLGGTVFASVDSLFAVLMLHLCGQLSNLRRRLVTLPKAMLEQGAQSFDKALSLIVTRHQFLQRFANSIENSFNVMFLAQMIASVIVMCFQGYLIVMMTTSDKGIPIFEFCFLIYFTLCFSFNLFIYCFIAEELRVESTGIASAAYDSEWYDLPPCKTKLLMFIMNRAKQPFQITAGKFAIFSLELYCNILKTSGGYLSVLLAVKDTLID